MAINRKGFTMVELLAVIVIIGVLSTIGVVAANRYLKESRQKSYLQMSHSLYEAATNCVLEENCTVGYYKIGDLNEESLVNFPEGYIGKLKNPNNSGDDCYGKVNIIKNGSAYKFEIQLNCPGIADKTLTWPETSDNKNDFKTVFRS